MPKDELLRTNDFFKNLSKCPFYVSDDFHFPRKKKHPELAYRSHEFFDPSLAPAFPTRQELSQAANRERVRKFTQFYL